MKKLLLLLTFLSTTVLAFAQQGTLTGKVKDKKTGEAIIGATVAVTGTEKGATTDINGNFSIPLEAGAYKITVTYVSYKSQNFDNVTITAGQPTALNIALEESATSLASVTVMGTKQTNTEISLLTDIKKSNIVVSGMSAEQITKTQDRDAAETVKRIPGVTIMDNRFIVVRGLSERYNSVLLNNALAPSSEVDVRAFSFDVLPTSVIDRILIYKSPAPEMPGDFAGGAIKIYTKNVVDQNATSFGISTSYRTNTTFRDFVTYDGGKTDMLGFDDGTRQLPNNFPVNLDLLNNTEKAASGRELPNIWQPSQITATPDFRFNFGMNRRLDLGKTQLSSITSLNYSNVWVNQFVNRFNYDENAANEVNTPINWTFDDQVSSRGVRVGVLQNFALRLNENNKIEFRNLFNQIGVDQATTREGYVQDIGKDERNYYMRYEQRSVYAGQLQGSHTSKNEKNTFTWTTGYNYINRTEPDLRRVRTTRDFGTEADYKVSVPYLSTPLDAGRFYSKLNETAVIAEGQLEHVFATSDSLKNEADSRIKVGFYAERKDRDFSARTITMVRTSATDANLLNQPLSQIFAPENLTYPNGFVTDEGTDVSDRYDAANTLGAAYIAGSKVFFDKLNVYGGVRAEYNLRELTARDNTRPANVNDPSFFLLPSLNVAYNFSLRSLLRFGYGMTVNRPEFREQAKFSFYDFIENASVMGNPDLKTASIQNLDLRYEFYPHPTESISLGGFYKRFTNPIESYIIPGSGSSPTYTFGNGDKAYSMGLETEIRKSFLDLSASKFIQNHSLILNASLIHSRVDLGAQATNQERFRPLMGQSPYVINAGLYYQNDDNGWQYSLLYNVLGKRIYRVGSNVDNPTIYEMPRNVLDLTVTKNFKNGMQLKGGVSDLFNQNFRFIQDTDRSGKVESSDNPIATYKRGVYSTLGLSYNF